MCVTSVRETEHAVNCKLVQCKMQEEDRAAVHTEVVVDKMEAAGSSKE
jgi:hypothetical protein